MALTLKQALRGILGSVCAAMGGALMPAVLILSGCIQTEVRPTAVEKVIAEISAKPSEPSPAPPEVVSQVLLAPPQGGSATSAGSGVDRFDVSVDQVPAKSFFLGLVSGTGTNIVVHPDLSGTISLELTNVTVEDVLSVTRDIYGYEYRRAQGIYTIYPRKLRTQVYPINYIDVQRVGVSDTSVLVGNISSSNNNNSNNNNNSSNNNSSQQHGTNLLGLIPDRNQGESGGRSGGITPGSRVQTLTKTDFWTSLQETIRAIVGNDEGERMVMVNPQAGMVVVKALPDEHAAVRDFLERSELTVKRQVVLETKILEVRLKDEFEAGINWSAINGQVLLTNNVTEFVSPADITGYSEAAGEIFSSIIQVGDISELLNLLETQGNVHVLSSPRVSTVNNQKAIIRVGSDEFFVTGISNETTATAATATSAPNIELSSFFSGISLDVTPQIAEDGDVILHIHPVVSEVQDQQKEITVGDEKFSLPLALRDIRESDSIVRAKNGQVVVLGGLMQESVADTRSKRPFIGDIPLVNTLFRTKSKRKVKTELVILMRPIVVDEHTWKKQIDMSRNRIQSLGDEYRSTR